MQTYGYILVEQLVLHSYFLQKSKSRPADICLFKLTNEYTIVMCEICPKLTI